MIMSSPVLCDHHKLMKHLLGLMNLGHTVFWMLWQLLQGPVKNGTKLSED